MLNKIRTNINFQDLIFDLLLYLLFFIFNSIVQKGKGLAESMSIWLILLVLISIILLIPWYLGVLCKTYSKKVFSKWGLRFIYSIGLTLSFILTIYPPYMISLTKKHEDFFIIYIFIFIIFGLPAIVLGWTSGLSYKDNIDNPKKSSRGLSDFFNIIFLILGPFAGFIGIFMYAFEGISITAIILIIIFISFIINTNSQSEIANYFKSKNIRYYIFPFILCLSLVFIHEIILDINFSLNETNWKNSLIVLFVSGLLPTRMLMLFSPPIKKINFIMGVISIILIIYDYVLIIKI